MFPFSSDIVIPLVKAVYTDCLDIQVLDLYVKIDLYVKARV